MFLVPHHIIAIGASAGSMKEINSFFDHTPPDGVSYVIIQHLSPDFKSSMAELLGRHSKLKVIQAENNMRVGCNEVYLIPNTKFMTIKDNKFHLINKEKGNGPHLTINKFFISLAADKGSKAIAVVLSGLGKDGSDGVHAIKKAGGMVIARNPDTAEFSSMPLSAIKTGMVDYILEPEFMPDKIEEYINIDEKKTSENKIDEQNTIAIIQLIKNKLPLDFSEYKQATILRRIKRRAAYNNFTKLTDFLEFLKNNPEEIKLLAKDFLISVTTFFRDPGAFDCIEKEVLPIIGNNLRLGEEIKIWVPGCATGEEAYSIAILMQEYLMREDKNIIVKIFATDIDTVALMHARKGIYAKESTKNISEQRLSAYFTKEKDQYKIIPGIRKMVIFAQHDIIKNPPYCNMNFISCRNLLIYITAAIQKKIFQMLLFGLKPAGYLFLGSSESPNPISKHLEIISKKWRLYRNIETKKFEHFEAFILPIPDEKKSTVLPFLREGLLLNPASNLTDAVNNELVNKQGKLVICIDENKNVIKYYGDATKYLLQKNFNLHLASLLPPPLEIAFNTLSRQAQKTNEKVTINGINILHNNLNITVSISVMPLVLKKEEQYIQMITIYEETKINLSSVAINYNEKNYQNQYTLNLEEELDELKEKLQETYLQLEATNENMQSYNEELLSANEEMQSTNEEMQSVNEELSSINAEYQLKNKELLDLNDDLNNYFRSNINGQLFVNKDLLLMKYSPGSVKQINVLANDIGRPLGDLSTNIKFETIIQDIKNVLIEGNIITKEIETSDGKWYQIMTMPYLQQTDNKINGAIITFNDITELKKIQNELKSMGRINSDLNNFVYTASHDLLAPLGNIELSIGVMNKVKVIDPDLNKFLGIINTSVKKFRTLINDLSIIAKIESEMLATEIVDLEEIIKDIEWSLEDKIKLSDARIICNFHVKQFKFSKKNLRSILFNLISNSIKFRGTSPPEIYIVTTREKDEILISVKDNGIGINKIDKDRIFEIYGRLHRDIEGKGIGLYLAKKIIDAANGNITVESEPGKGAKFTIFLKTEPTI